MDGNNNFVLNIFPSKNIFIFLSYIQNNSYYITFSLPVSCTFYLHLIRTFFPPVHHRTIFRNIFILLLCLFCVCVCDGFGCDELWRWRTDHDCFVMIVTKLWLVVFVDTKQWKTKDERENWRQDTIVKALDDDGTDRIFNT